MRRSLSIIATVLASTIGVASHCAAEPPFIPVVQAAPEGYQNWPLGRNPQEVGDSQLANTPNSSQPENAVRPALTLSEIERIAISSNPTLAKASAEIEAARGRWVQSGLYPNPTIGYAGDEMGDEGSAGKQGGFVQQEIVTAGKLRLHRDVTAREIQQAEQRFAAQQFRVLTDVRAVYYEILIAQERIRVSGRIAEISEQSSVTARRLLDARQASRVEVLEADVEEETAHLAAARAQSELVTAMRRLAAIAGRPEIEFAQVAGELTPPPPPIDWNAQLVEIRQMSPERATALAAAERARLSLRQAFAERVPNIDVSTTLQKDNATGDTITSVQVGVPLPIFNRNQGAIHEAEANITVSERDIDRLDLEIQQRLATVYQRVVDSQREISRYRDVILPKSEESMRLVAAGYSAGELSYLNLLTAQRMYFRTSLQYLDLLREAWTAHVEIKGLLLSGNLSQVRSADGSPAEK